MDTGGGAPPSGQAEGNVPAETPIRQQQPSVTVSTPSKKLHDIGRRPPLHSMAAAASQGGEVHHPFLGATLGLLAHSTPRIDISRASSSSQHEDSRDSSPENVFEQVGTGTLQETIGLGFREEGALELRSSTEELYFMDPEQKREEQEKMQQTRKSPVVFKFDEHHTYLQQHQRKDSASSEVAALLCISGRTSRISSVGSQGSAVSRLSAVSGISRSPSPHRMLLETSFCGPKPLENVVDGSIVSTVEPPTAEALEQVLLSRKHDPTQAVLAEGIKIENSPKKKLTNGEPKPKAAAGKAIEPRVGKPISAPVAKTGIRRGIGAVTRKDGRQVVGVTPSGTEYIRINLKPDHMYEDKGVGPNERIVDSGTTSSGQKKPATLSLGRDVIQMEQRLTPSSSPKPARHAALTREIGGSRSPSPATVGLSRKSSFCSLFKTKDSPDSPRDRSRSRSKSRDRSTPVSQSGTPNKQRSVLAIFKPKRSGSKSKCSSPIDQDSLSQLDGISQVEFKFKSDTPEPRSRPQSRLKYYETPLDGKSIHIPLHTPPEEKEARKFAQTEEIKESKPPPPQPQSQIATPAEAPIQPYIEPALPARQEQPPALPVKSPKPQQIEKVHRIENLGAIHSLPSDVADRERTWSLEVHRHSSQDSQETVIIDSCMATRIAKATVMEEPSVRENGIPPRVPQQPPIIPPMSQHGDHVTREKRRLLFAARLGSGSQEQIFSTQFSLSKTESLSSQLSEQTSIPESPAVEGREMLHRSDTVLRRPEDVVAFQKKKEVEEIRPTEAAPMLVGTMQKKESLEDDKSKSKSTSEEEEKRPVVVMMRKKDSSDDAKRKSKSASEEDDSTNRHSRYIENFDVKKKFQESNKRQTSKNSSDSSIKERDSHTSSREDTEIIPPPALPAKGIKPHDPSIPLPQPPIERQSLLSTDEHVESSESERDSEMDPNRIRRHLPRHIGAIEDHESTGLVSQDSFEDELPYVPTTLPEERALGVALIPMKDRINFEIKTCPVDRPRSTTPMNPACLEEYCGIVGPPEDSDNLPIRGTKLRISLPRKDSMKDKTQKTKSPRRVSNVSGKSWFEFAEQGIRGGVSSSTTTPTYPLASVDRRDSKTEEEPPPPLPPRKPSSSTQWINFENIPEKRKPPKRITALPRDSPQDPSRNLPSVQYNYVKPEECQCECHGVERDPGPHKTITDVDLLQQGGEDLQPLLEPESHECIDPSDSSLEYSYSGEVPTTIEKPPRVEEVTSRQRPRRSSTHSQDPDSPDRSSTPHRDSSRPKRSQDFRKS